MGAGSPMFYGLPKEHKEGLTLRTIVSTRGTVIYMAKQLVRIPRPLVDKSPTTLITPRTL